MSTTITRKTAKKIVTPEAVIAQAALEANAAPEVAAPEAQPPVQAAASTWTAWPTSASLGFEPVDLPKYFGPKHPNSLGVAASWTRSEVRAARMARHSVRVTFNGTVSEYKSVAEAFRALRLPFEKHIRFRLALKASGKESFTHNDHIYIFEAVAAEAAPVAVEGE